MIIAFSFPAYEHGTSSHLFKSLNCSSEVLWF